MAQSAESQQADTSKFPTRGVRFVICSPTGERLPTPLYAKVGNDYLPVTISPRMPSPRLAPTGAGNEASVKFYESIPDAKELSERKVVPYLEIKIPKNHRNKSICVVQPKKSGEQPITHFINEASFEKGSSYVINFSQTPLEMITSTSGKFSGEEKKAKIDVYTPSSTISKKSPFVWGHESKKENEKVYFVLLAQPKGGTEPLRIKSSVFMTSPISTQMSFIVEHPTIKGSFRLMSIQYNDDAEKRTNSVPKRLLNGRTDL